MTHRKICSFALLFSLLVAGLIATAASPSGHGVLVVANQGEHTLLVVDPASRTQLASVTVGVNGHEVAASKDGRFAYVPIYGNSVVGRPGTDGSTIDIVDLHTHKLAGSIDLGKPVRPHCAKFGPDGLLYVSAELANAVYVVDVNTRKVVGEIPSGQPETHMLVIAPDGSRAYTANVGSGSVSALDLKSRKLITTIPVAKRVQRISVSVDGHRVFTHDQDSPRIAVIDTTTNKVASWIELPSVAYSSAPTPDGKFLLAASSAGKLFVIDLATLKVTKSADVPSTSGELSVMPDGTVAYLSCPQAGIIAVYNLRSGAFEEPIKLSKGVDGLEWLPASE